jgi:hypothetical protein
MPAGNSPEQQLHTMSATILTFESSQFDNQFSEAAHIIESAARSSLSDHPGHSH